MSREQQRCQGVFVLWSVIRKTGIWSHLSDLPTGHCCITDG